MPKTETTEKIEIAAIRLFADNGYNGTSTKRIAEEAGVSELTIFRHYGSKDELFRQCFFRQVPEKWLRDLQPNPTAPLEKQILTLCEALYKTLIARIDLIRIVQRDATEHPEILERVKGAPSKIWGPVSEYLNQVGSGMEPNDYDKIAFQLWATYFGIVAMMATVGHETLPFPVQSIHESVVAVYTPAIKQLNSNHL